MTLVDGPQDGATEVTVWSLELTSRDGLKPARLPKVDATLMQAERPAPELSKFFYELVGSPWQWVDRLTWPDARWREWVDRPEHHLTTCWVDGSPAGYYELEQQGSSVEIAYFGLHQAFIGQGLGGWLLSNAIEQAFALPETSRVWLHTCSLDGPAALANYQARGLAVFEESVEWRLSGQTPLDR
jgi:GNAT superfamily N-acetyltransferase